MKKGVETRPFLAGDFRKQPAMRNTDTKRLIAARLPIC